MSISRAVNELTELKICKQIRKKNIELIFNKNKEEIWNSSLPYFINPVLKTFYTDDLILNNNYLITGINALSHYTEIS